MDDLKLYGKDNNELEGLLRTVKAFSDDNGMEFGLEKCAKATFQKGKVKTTNSVVLDVDTVIRELEQEQTYKYLGINEGSGIQHASMNEIRKECYRRVRAVLKSELNARNKVLAINSLAVPVATYSYNVLNWNMSELKNIDRKIRKLLSCNRMHHPKADVDRLYLPRAQGGRGLIQFELAYKTTTIGLAKYLEISNDWMLKLVENHERRKKLHSIIKESKKFAIDLVQDTQTEQPEGSTATIVAKKVKMMAMKKAHEQLADRWEEKPLHGKYVTRSKQADVDQKQTHQWLRSSGLKAESEGFILAAQDQSLLTRNYQANVMKNGADPKCRFCNDMIETVDHLISGCKVLAPVEYKLRHDRVGQYLHWLISRHYNIKTADKWYNHHPEAVTEGENVTILWDFPVHTDQ